ncbi:hypothetical protein [Streptosporangium sandarakinum]|uniref:hypothetical protein n=1 Tax=Streptosporangium sandarakinum TaxID=1260955 RepID=UPI00341C791C
MRAGPSVSRPTLLAGWLFADLLLGLTIIMLGAQAPPEPPKASAGPEAGGATATPAPSPSPCATRVAGVKAEPVKVTFRVSPGADDKALNAQVKKELLAYRDRLTGRHAGMVLTFGAGSGPGEGARLATRVNAAARKAYPSVFEAAATRDFHDLSAPGGTISMEIYFVSDGCAPATDRS